MKAARRPGAQEVTYGMIESGHKFHSLIQAGLTSRPDRNVLSLVGRSLHPSFYRGLYWRRRREVISENLTIDHVAMPNVRVLKQVWAMVGFFVGSLRWRVQTRHAGQRVLIMDAAYISALPAVLLALTGSKVKRVAIFCDVYSHMANVSDSLTRGVNVRALLGRAVSWLYRRLNGFVLLTEQMNPIVNRAGKPHLVMEGIVDGSMISHENLLSSKTAHPTVMYTGALRKQYGLDWLVDGFRDYDNPDARLVIYGAGDFSGEIQDAAAEDSRICYGGTLPNADVVRKQEQAWLLINPRPTDQEFTRLSFPSKVMEYMVSGTPVLTTRLPGMPDEYLDYVYTIEGSGSRAVTQALQERLGLPLTQLHAQGEVNKAFVLERKNHVAQADRIIAFARSC